MSAPQANYVDIFGQLLTEYLLLFRMSLSWQDTLRLNRIEPPADIDLEANFLVICESLADLLSAALFQATSGRRGTATVQIDPIEDSDPRVTQFLEALTAHQPKAGPGRFDSAIINRALFCVTFYNVWYVHVALSAVVDDGDSHDDENLLAVRLGLQTTVRLCGEWTETGWSGSIDYQRDTRKLNEIFTSALSLGRAIEAVEGEPFPDWTAFKTPMLETLAELSMTLRLLCATLSETDKFLVSL